MAYTIPLEFYEMLEEKVGKETASKLVKVLENSIENAINDGFERQKIVISEELKKELASKYDIELLKRELESKIENLELKLENKIEKLESKLNNRIDRLEAEISIVKKDVDVLRKEMRFMFILLLVVMVALNQNS